MKHLVAIVGPTGIGKSRLALHLAQKFDGEIVGADSRQVYKFIDIGTAKPDLQDREIVRHHMIDIVEPDAEFSLAHYKELAFEAISDVQKRHKLPIIVGGSGLYVKAVLEGWQMPQVKPDPELRRRLEKHATDSGSEGLHRELLEINPAEAQKIDPRNVRRVIRALEVYGKAYEVPSRLQGKQPLPYPMLIIGLTTERKALYELVDKRVDGMIEQGLVAEVEKLVDMGYDFNLPALSSIGYKQISMYIRGEISLEDATQQIKYETHRFVRHQYAWFRLDDKRIHWFDIAKGKNAEIEALVSAFLENKPYNKESLIVSTKE